MKFVLPQFCEIAAIKLAAAAAGAVLAALAAAAAPAAALVPAGFTGLTKPQQAANSFECVH
jgi:hypothetical protein